MKTNKGSIAAVLYAELDTNRHHIRAAVCLTDTGMDNNQIVCEVWRTAEKSAAAEP